MRNHVVDKVLHGLVETDRAPGVLLSAHPVLRPNLNAVMLRGANTVPNVGPLLARLASVMLETGRNVAHKLVATKADQTALGTHALVKPVVTEGRARLKAKAAIVDQRPDLTVVHARTGIVRHGPSEREGPLALQMIVLRGRLIARLDQVKRVFRIVQMRVVPGVRAHQRVEIRSVREPDGPPREGLQGRANVTVGRRPLHGARHGLLVVSARPVAPIE